MSLTSVCLFKIVSSRIIVCDNPRPRSRWELGESMRARRAQAGTAQYQTREQSVAPTNMNARNGRIGESVCNVERSRLVKATSDLSNSLDRAQERRDCDGVKTQSDASLERVIGRGAME